jgi:hypothetical protein
MIKSMGMSPARVKNRFLVSMLYFKSFLSSDNQKALMFSQSKLTALFLCFILNLSYRLTVGMHSSLFRLTYIPDFISSMRQSDLSFA